MLLVGARVNIGTLHSFYHAGRAPSTEQRLSVPAALEVTMAKFRFPGKALKLNTRKRVRFRGSHATNTPEELYTRRIRKGLDLFTQIFGDSDEVRMSALLPTLSTWRQLHRLQSIACNIIPSPLASCVLLTRVMLRRAPENNAGRVGCGWGRQ